MAFCAWIRLSCGLVLLSSGTISTFLPWMPPFAFTSSARNWKVFKPTSPTLAPPPDNGSMYPILSVSCAITAPPNIGNAKAAAIISLRMSFLPGICFCWVLLEGPEAGTVEISAIHRPLYRVIVIQGSGTRKSAADQAGKRPPRLICLEEYGRDRSLGHSALSHTDGAE